MKKWLKRFWPFRKKKTEIPYPGYRGLGPCKVMWGDKGQIPLVWPIAEVSINIQDEREIRLILPTHRPLMNPLPLQYTVKRFSEKRELRIENLFPDWKCGGISDMKIYFYKTSFILIDVANKVVKYRIHSDDNFQYGKME